MPLARATAAEYRLCRVYSTIRRVQCSRRGRDGAPKIEQNAGQCGAFCHLGNLGHVSRAAAITTVSPVAAGGPRRRSSCWGICCSAGGVRAGSELCEQALAGDTSPQQRLAEKGLESSSRPDKSCFSAVPGHKYRARSREGPSTALPCADSGTPARADRPAASRKLLRASLIGQEQ